MNFLKLAELSTALNSSNEMLSISHRHFSLSATLNNAMAGSG
jgi:hypothetical protein